MRCLHSYDIHCKSNGHSYRISCGKCPACRKRKRNEYVFRLELEKRFGIYKNCWFVTLTYAPKYEKHWSARLDRKTGELVGYVESDKYVLPSKDDVQAFLNRLRQQTQYRYLCVSQYGEEKDRAHYHLALFMNEDWHTAKDMIEFAWSCHKSFTSKERLERLRYKRRFGHYPPSKPRELFGRVNIKSMSLRRFRYISRYMLRSTKDSPEYSPAEELVPNFHLMSKGLGKEWLHSYECLQLAKRNDRLAYFSDGKPVSVPRYFVYRMYKPEQIVEYQSMMDKIDLGSILLSEKYTPQKYMDWYESQLLLERNSQNAFINRLFYNSINGNF